MFRLAIGLVLVIVVMREARRPNLYQPFFAAGAGDWVDVESDAGEPKTHDSLAPSQLDTPARGSVAAINDAKDRGNVDRSAQDFKSWVSQMDVDLQRAWIEALFVWRESNPTGSESFSWRGLTEKQLLQSSAALERTTFISGADIKTRIERDMGRILMSVRPDSGTKPISPNSEWWWTQPLTDALDAAAINRVEDGTFWTGNDSDAFYLQLFRSPNLPADAAPTTGTLPLLQQPDVYRGAPIRLVGTLGLAEIQAAKPNRMGIEKYWKLWIIPDDGGIRPTVLMTLSLPASIQQSLTPDGKWDSQSSPANPEGRLAAVGRFLKRLPYRSSVGADLAPVVIGRVVATPGTAESPAATRSSADQADESATDSASYKTAGVALTILTGILLAAGLMYRTSVDAERTRRLRQQSTESAAVDLSGLNDRLGGADEQRSGESP